MIFKKLEYQHLAEIKNWAGHESIKNWIAIEDWDTYYEYAINEPATFLFALYDNNNFIGELTAEKDDENKCLYIALTINPKFQNRGFGVRVLNYFKENAKCLVEGESKYISVGIDKNNIASIKCFEKAGYVYQDEDEEINNYVLYL